MNAMKKSRSGDGDSKRYATVGEGQIRIAPILALPSLMADLGVDVWPLVALAGIDRQLVSDPEKIL